MSERPQFFLGSFTRSPFLRSEKRRCGLPWGCLLGSPMALRLPAGTSPPPGCGSRRPTPASSHSVRGPKPLGACFLQYIYPSSKKVFSKGGYGTVLQIGPHVQSTFLFCLTYISCTAVHWTIIERLDTTGSSLLERVVLNGNLLRG